MLIKKFGSLLRKEGIQEKDVLALYSPNCIEYPVSLIGASGVGGIVSTASPLYTANELAFQLKDSAAKFLVTKKALLETARAAADVVGIDKIILLDETDSKEADVLCWSDITNDDGIAFVQPCTINPKDDLAVLPYSSGTTGKPKGVMLSHHNVIANTVQTKDHVEEFFCYRQKCLGILLFFHIYGMVMGVFYNLWEGKTLVTLPRFEPESFLAAIANHKVRSYGRASLI